LPATRLYDRIGSGYPTTRRTEPRIAALIHAGLGDAETVVNVGAGTGSYEPAGRRVTAVEPSAVMIGQRPAGAAPAVQAAAERLPFEDRSFDAAMAVWTVHHWDDPAAGLGELRRVARDRVVIATWDPAFRGEFWLIGRYLPHVRDQDAAAFPALAAIASALAGTATVTPIPVPRECVDGFLGAFWARPEAYLDPAVRAGMSTLAAAGESVLAEGLTRLAADLDSGEWDARYGHLRSLPELDLGYRVIVARRG
jgi:SAM-dependent methyltransferase